MKTDFNRFAQRGAAPDREGFLPLQDGPFAKKRGEGDVRQGGGRDHERQTHTQREAVSRQSFPFEYHDGDTFTAACPHPCGME